jgi:hypothetical protein
LPALVQIRWVEVKWICKSTVLDGAHGTKTVSKDTPVKFDSTKKREKGGNTVPKTSAENHDGPRATGKRIQVPTNPSKRVTASTDSLLDDSKVSGTTRREPSAPAKIRSANNLRRDQNTNLGRGKSSDVVLGG